MALRNCPECGKMISDKAERCPHCGANPRKAGVNVAPERKPLEAMPLQEAPMESQKLNRRTLWMILVPLILIGVGVGIWVPVYQHKKAEELARIEQIRQDSIAAAEAERLRQDSIQAAKDERLLNLEDEYFLIIASFDLEENAENYISKQQARLGLIEYDGHYRVFVASSNTLKEITQYKKKFEDSYPNAWIFHKKDPNSKSVKTSKTQNNYNSKQQATVSQNNKTSQSSISNSTSFRTPTDVLAYLSGKTFYGGGVSLKISYDAAYVNGTAISGAPIISNITPYSALIRISSPYAGGQEFRFYLNAANGVISMENGDKLYLK